VANLPLLALYKFQRSLFNLLQRLPPASHHSLPQIPLISFGAQTNSALEDCDKNVSLNRYDVSLLCHVVAQAICLVPISQLQRRSWAVSNSTRLMNQLQAWTLLVQTGQSTIGAGVAFILQRPTRWTRRIQKRWSHQL
jgi:hypothetical protein